LAKRRIGEAASSKKEYPSFFRTVARRLREDQGARGRHRASSEDGFTLIELVVVTAVMPMIVGALAVGLLSVFSLQSSVSNRLTDSGDAQVVSVNFQNDVQSASSLTTANTPTSAPAACQPASGSGFQVLGLQLGNGNEISYVATQASGGKSYDLFRNVCSAGSSVPTSSEVMARDMPASIVNPATPPVTITCTTSSATCANTPPSNEPAYELNWQSTLGVSAVTFNTTEPGSKFNYTLVATPLSAANSSQLAQVSKPSTGCDFATLGTGTYAQTLCFADFTPWNTQTPPTTVIDTCSAAQAGFSSPLPMAARITGSPFTLDFCMSVSSVLNSNGQAITGQTSAPAACGVAARTGYDDITASPLPTYACPPGSEAFLGNNGFYTGVQGAPALYEVDEGSTATINITNIELLNSNGSAATNWQLVTGDAESTDPGESITWSTDNASIPFQLLPNSANSDIGNACNSTPPGITATSPGLVGIGTDTVVCSTTNSTDKTGTPMLTATTPTSLTVTLLGGGLQAMFMGILLQAT